MSFANPLPWWALVLIVRWRGVWSRGSPTAAAPCPRRAARSSSHSASSPFSRCSVSAAPRGPRTDARRPRCHRADTRGHVAQHEPRGRAGAGRRIDRARRLVIDRLLPALGSQFHVEVLGFGEAVAPDGAGGLAAAARRSDLGAALAAIRDRYRGQAVAGIVLLSDGGDTSGAGERAAEGGPPIYAVASGRTTAGKDREILSVTAAEAVLDDSRVDLAVSAVSHGLGNATDRAATAGERPAPIDVRRVTPAAEGTPVREVFHVSPGRGAPTVYTVETPVAAGELVPENNARSVLVQPPARAPGVSCWSRVRPGSSTAFSSARWTSDPGSKSTRSCARARTSRAPIPSTSRPRSRGATALDVRISATREALFRYDAVVSGERRGHQLTQAPSSTPRALRRSTRRGLLVLGAQSFLRQGLGEHRARGGAALISTAERSHRRYERGALARTRRPT